MISKSFLKSTSDNLLNGFRLMLRERKSSHRSLRETEYRRDDLAKYFFKNWMLVFLILMFGFWNSPKRDGNKFGAVWQSVPFHNRWWRFFSYFLKIFSDFIFFSHRLHKSQISSRIPNLKTPRISYPEPRSSFSKFYWDWWFFCRLHLNLSRFLFH